MQSKLFDEADAMIAFLKRRKGTWEMQGEEIVFSTEADAEAWNGYASRMQQFGEAQQRLETPTPQP